MSYPPKYTNESTTIPALPQATGYVPEIIDALWDAERGMDKLVLATQGQDALRREAKAIQTAFRERRRALEDLEKAHNTKLTQPPR